MRFPFALLLLFRLYVWASRPAVKRCPFESAEYELRPSGWRN